MKSKNTLQNVNEESTADASHRLLVERQLDAINKLAKFSEHLKLAEQQMKQKLKKSNLDR